MSIKINAFLINERSHLSLLTVISGARDTEARHESTHCMTIYRLTNCFTLIVLVVFASSDAYQFATSVVVAILAYVYICVCIFIYLLI